MRVLKDGLHRTWRYKVNFGGVAIMARKRASGAGKEKNALARVHRRRFAITRDNAREQKNDEQRRWGRGVTLAELLTRLLFWTDLSLAAC